MPNVGMCIQGNNGGDTHVEELRFAYDFSLPVATPILAAADRDRCARRRRRAGCARVAPAPLAAPRSLGRTPRPARSGGC